MLKSLELNGFKSFAERTRFEFPSGITAIVGPNGSGKSNVVDAIRWVLGERSIKNLRGEVAEDVIFNGSGSRKPVNAAEVSMVFSNVDGVMKIEADEVRITRRIYRNGDTEYLINREVCRLKDIRDILAGTGMGSGAYSIIEQGKVDGLLQASPKERRYIFEEAAGISGFKRSKTEAQRRLERVAKNMESFSYIVAGEESRLSHLRSQAQRAVLYREYTQRMQELRLEAAAVDWSVLTKKITEVTQRLSAVTQDRDMLSEELEALESDLQKKEDYVTHQEEEIRLKSEEAARNLQAIGASESVVEHQLQRGRELEQRILADRKRATAFRVRVREIMQLHQAVMQESDLASQQHQQVISRLEEVQESLRVATDSLEKSKTENENVRQQSMQVMRTLAATDNEINSLEKQKTAADEQVLKRRDQLLLAQSELEKKRAELDVLRQEHEKLMAEHLKSDTEKSAAHKKLEESAKLWNAARTELSELTRKQSGISERISVLEDLEKQHEGLSPGVRYMLAESQKQKEGPLSDIRGLVADLFQVGVEAASLIEVVLGDRAQYVVAGPDTSLLAALEENAQGFPGRVGFIWMNQLRPAYALTTALEGLPGVLGRADQYVQCEPEYQDLIRNLLGETWIVEDLSTAVRLAHNTLQRVHFVTAAGERLDADGSVCVGPHQNSTGIISRRSELHQLRIQLTELIDKIHETEQKVYFLQEKTQEQQHEVESRTAETRKAEQELNRKETELSAAQERFTQSSKHNSEMQRLLGQEQQQSDHLQRSLLQCHQKKKDTEAELAQLVQHLSNLEESLKAQEEDRVKKSKQATQVQVELGKSEARLEGLRSRLAQFTAESQEHKRNIEDSIQQFQQNCKLLAEAHKLALENESRLALNYVEKDRINAALKDMRLAREDARNERGKRNAAATRLRKKLRTVEDKVRVEEVEFSRLELEKTQLERNISEAYNIDLSEYAQRDQTEEGIREAAEFQHEINDLRNKIARLGNVNQEALSELDEMEARYSVMKQKCDDLMRAKDQLVQIIERLNVDSRRQLLRTFERIKEHFSGLFRDLFGGGFADLQLEEGVDVLESGVEIVVQPPGKELRSISLMSGGEKTLTCVALLLAVFKNHPSPFCVLDEVDAALDESNIGRFNGVLNQFLDHTKFIIISHSKKTMSCANTIYGITMQESGVSKQISVCFEEVSENGVIHGENGEDIQLAE